MLANAIFEARPLRKPDRSWRCRVSAISVPYISFAHRGREYFATGDNRLTRSSSETNPLGIGPSLDGRVLNANEIHHNEDENSCKQENVADRSRKAVLKETVYKPR
jgi:hypothetical protein